MSDMKQRLVNVDSIIPFVLEHTQYFHDSENLVTEELSDGNINYVFRVLDKKSGMSLVIKHADDFLRSSGRPLDVERIKIEKEYLETIRRLSQNEVPEILYYNNKLHTMILEDIGTYKNVRYELMNGVKYDNFAKDISNFLGTVLLDTTDLVLDRHQKKELVKQFINVEMCDITEDLVLTEPYYDYKRRNQVLKEQEEYVKTELYQDQELHASIAELRNNYLNNAQCLLHGDLHTGSIFVKDSGIKIIDSEFAFFGPMGYDIGTLIANLYFSLVYQQFIQHNTEYSDWLKEVIVNVFTWTLQKLDQSYEEKVTLPLYRCASYKHQYFENIKQDILGYMGTEIIRRTIGDTSVKELNIQNQELHLKINYILLEFGKYVIMNRQKIQDSDEFMHQYNEMVKKFIHF